MTYLVSFGFRAGYRAKLAAREFEDTSARQFKAADEPTAGQQTILRFMVWLVAESSGWVFWRKASAFRVHVVCHRNIRYAGNECKAVDAFGPRVQTAA